LTTYGSLARRADLIFAGQLTGVEGYTESAASGILAGLNMARILDGQDAVIPPPTTMLGGLYRYLSESNPKHFQPMNSNWGLVEPLADRVRDKRQKREMLAARAATDFLAWMRSVRIEPSLELDEQGPTTGGHEVGRATRDESVGAAAGRMS
jgi:methylenetetrahydrofolate--tRNA-(uracil-5-)-methyltransferase